MNDKIRVSAVSYLNTKPLLYGIFKSPVVDMLDLVLDIPSVCAQKLKNGQADLGLVPVAIIPELNNPYIISDYCIGTVGPVKTVCIYADRPLEQLKRIYLDYHSRTSVELVKLLIKEHWKLDIDMIPAKPGFETSIGGRTGALVIGDRTMGLDERYPYVYDLGEAWIAHTGLPFVFAAWVSNRPLDEDFVIAFNQALQLGLDHLPELLYLLPAVHPGFDLKTYFTQNISYQLDEPKKRGLALFLQKMGSTVFPQYSTPAEANQLAGLVKVT